MPHLIVEYSDNLEDRIDLDGLLDRLYEVSVGYQTFPLGGLRIRAEKRERYRIADRHPENGFVHITVKIRAGRSLELRRQIAEGLFQAACGYLETAFRESRLAISLNIQELHAELNYNQNNLHEHIQATNAGTEP